METKFSINEEFFNFDSIEDALQDAKDEDMVLPVTVYEQEFKGADLSELIDAVDVQEILIDKLYNFLPEELSPNEFLNPITDEMEKKLKELIDLMQAKEYWKPVGDTIEHVFNEYPKDGE
jgi:hypothetical protein